MDNATQFTNTGAFFASVDTFNPLTSTDSALAEILKGAYSRGVCGMKLEFNSISDPNIRMTQQCSTYTRYTGLRLPTSMTFQVITTLITTLRILNYLESVGESWDYNFVLVVVILININKFIPLSVN